MTSGRLSALARITADLADPTTVLWWEVCPFHQAVWLAPDDPNITDPFDARILGGE